MGTATAGQASNNVILQPRWRGSANEDGKSSVSFFHVSLLGVLLEGEDGAGEGADLAGAAPEPVEDLPVFQDCEAAFAVGADSGVAAVGVLVGVRQVPPLVGGEQGESFAAGVALVGVQVQLCAVGEIEHAVGAGGGQVVGGAGEPIGGPDEPSVGVGQPLQVDPVVAVLDAPMVVKSWRAPVR